LEQEPNLAWQFTSSSFLSEELRSTQHAGHVEIVTTGVHPARYFRSIVNRILLLQRQSIHVRPQGNARTSLPYFAHHSSQGHTRLEGNAQFGQSVRDQLRRLVLFKPQFGMAMELPP
jgi:hypothetical protein